MFNVPSRNQEQMYPLFCIPMSCASKGNIRVFCRVCPQRAATPTEVSMKLEYQDQGIDNSKLVLAYPPTEVC